MMHDGVGGPLPVKDATIDSLFTPDLIQFLHSWIDSHERGLRTESQRAYRSGNDGACPCIEGAISSKEYSRRRRDRRS